MFPLNSGAERKRATYSALNNARGISIEVDYSAYTAAEGKSTGGQSMYPPLIAPCFQTNVVQVLQDSLLLVPDSYFSSKMP